MLYTVKKATDSFDVAGQWDGEGWAIAETLELKQYMGNKPGHFPRTQAKVLYDAENIYVFFRVEDRYVRAVAENFYDRVCEDSCVEFFFTPGDDISKGYFNLEANCGGVIFFCHQTAREENSQRVASQDCQTIKLWTSMPKIVEPEIKEPTLWMVQYVVPYEILKKYGDVNIPAEGVKWRANFYKCANATSHPHWLTWAKVDKPEPNFHLPEYFGTLVFE